MLDIVLNNIWWKLSSIALDNSSNIAVGFWGLNFICQGWI